MASNGIIFIATGRPYIEAANAAARSVREMVPGVGVDLFCDETGAADAALFDEVHPISDPHRRSKVDCLPKTRFEKTLYLDTDIRIAEDISDLFELLPRFDIALAHAHSRNREQTTQVWREKIPDATRREG